jgi:protein-L-isoaspartate(D-aspartate) O-methyltransferase
MGVFTNEEFTRKRFRMVNDQIIARGVKDPLVLEAMSNVPRHEFVLPVYHPNAYEDGPLPIGFGQTISQPYIVAEMTALAQITPESKVLEIGTGCGYQTAVLAEIASQVYSIEIVNELGLAAAERLRRMGYENVHIRIGDGYQGWPEEAPFHAIVVAAAPSKIPQPLIDQLTIGGNLVIPVGEYHQELEVISKTADGIQRRRGISVRFVPMTGKAEKK